MSVPDQDIEKASDGPQKPLFRLQKIYLKDVSFESPAVPEVFALEWNPSVDLQFDSDTEKVADNLFEVSVAMTVTATVEEKIAYLIEVTQAGLFHLEGYDNKTLKEELNTTCPAVLFPYVRAEVSKLVASGGFPQMLLAPINFHGMYDVQQVKEELG